MGEQLWRCHCRIVFACVLFGPHSAPVLRLRNRVVLLWVESLRTHSHWRCHRRGLLLGTRGGCVRPGVSEVKKSTEEKRQMNASFPAELVNGIFLLLASSVACRFGDRLDRFLDMDGKCFRSGWSEGRSSDILACGARRISRESLGGICLKRRVDF